MLKSDVIIRISQTEIQTITNWQLESSYQSFDQNVANSYYYETLVKAHNASSNNSAISLHFQQQDKMQQGLKII